MREIISLHLGQAGNSIGCKFWEYIANEHGLENTGTYTGKDDLQLEHMDVYFKELRSHKYVPRMIAVDLEPGTRDSVLQSTIGRIFRPENVIVGLTGGGNNWAKGRYTEGSELFEPVLEVVRREAEKSECLQGFQLTHCPGGATGGGMASLVLDQLIEEYPDLMMSTFTVTPTPKVSSVVEPYNFVLTTTSLIESCDVSFLMDNETIYDFIWKRFNLRRPQYSDLNSLISQVMAGVTTFFRFPSQNSLNSDLRRLSVNMIPFPRLHFLETGLAPLTMGNTKPNVSTLSDLSATIFDRTNSMSAYSTMHPGEQYLSLSILVHGDLSFDDAHAQIHQARLASPYHRQANWISEDTQVSKCSVAPNGLKMAATLLGNTTAIRGIFEQFYDGFHAMFKRKAFLHWYTAEGMDEMEFTEAEANLLDVIAEYQEMLDVTTSDTEENE
ncbi:beta tubulin [Flagelloscypha sp. PMI_526]|nr:beta tubulin [Flagelloscypha sp. PMI_526]